MSTGLLKGSWDLVTRVISKVTILITPMKVVKMDSLQGSLQGPCRR